jgi:methyltransferase
MSHEFKIFLGIVLFLVLGRLYELYLTKKNEKVWIDEFHGVEVGVFARKFMVVMHLSWFFSILIEGYYFGSLALIPIQILSFMMLIIAQLLRFHSMAMLRNLWTTRVYNSTKAPICRDGLYKSIKHPNYVAVILEFIAVPLQLNLWWSLIFFSILNLFFLRIRMNLEEEVFGNKLAPWRMIPGLY